MKRQSCISGMLILAAFLTGAFITGVGVSDNHNVKDWDLRDNRMGTWLRAPSDSSANLADVVVIAPGQSHELSVNIHGASTGDQLVWFQNGFETSREPFSSAGTIDTSANLLLNPGDWVRVEVHTSTDKSYLPSNPIYFVENANEVPAARTP